MFYKKNNTKQEVNQLNKGQKKEISFQLYDRDNVLITGTFIAFTEIVKQLIKNHQGQFSNYDGDKGWLIPIVEYNNLMIKIREVQPDIVVKSMPHFLQRLKEPFSNCLKYYDNGQTNKIDYSSEPAIIELDNSLKSQLYEYQREAIKKGIQFRGRILIADEMGVGKTVQSLALASAYRHAWPLLIISPPSLRLVWQDEIIHWLKINREDMQIITKQKQQIRLNAQILIISYDFCPKFEQQLLERNFKIAIADECHYLKSAQAQRSQACVPILKRCMYVFLLTGTPALAKPKDLFNQLSIIRPDIFNSFKEFGYRYCDPKLSRFSGGIDFDGASNLKELHYILVNYIMIRRLKKNVLSELPEKRRIRVRIQGDAQVTKQIQALLSKLDQIDLDSLMRDQIIFDPVTERDKMKQDQFGAQQIFNKCYVLTGTAKIKAIKEYLSEFLKNDIKFIFFAHHLEVLDGVQDLCVSNDVKFIRVDGTINSEQKHFNVRMFQECDEVKVAILGITSANFGITLTAASCVVFGEMHWTPAIMLQAEDRAHRIGQNSSVDCHYLIGEETIDEYIYDKLEAKMNTVSNLIDGAQQKLDAKLEREQVGLSKQIQKQQIQQQQKVTQSAEDIDIDEVIELLESQKKEQQQKQIRISQQLQQQASQLKQTLLDQYCRKSLPEKEIQFLQDEEDFKRLDNFEKHQQKEKEQQQEKQLQFKQKEEDQLNFNYPQKKLGIEYLSNRKKQSESHKKSIESMSKETNQGSDKRQLINFKDNYAIAEEKMKSTKKNLI